MHENDQHWKDLADQLGLEPDTRPAQPEPAKPVRDREQTQEAPRSFEEPPARQPEPAEESIGRASAEPSGEGEGDRGAERERGRGRRGRGRGRRGESGDRPPREPSGEASGGPEGESEGGRGRRRRRGRGRGRRDEAPATGEVTASGEGEANHQSAGVEENADTSAEETLVAPEGREEEGDEESQGRRRRGRGRSRRRSRRDDDAPAASSEEAADQNPAEQPEEDDDSEEIDSLSDWNVPSWTELISSLYRPDR